MKSPFTGGDVVRYSETRTATFRKEQYEYTFVCYKCVDTGELFTTEQQDNVNTIQVYNQFRAKYGIPYPDEIRRLRAIYGLSASKMSLILGLGDNQYRLYENGNMPNVSIGRTLQAIKTPQTFLNYVNAASGVLDHDEYKRIVEKIGNYNGGDARSIFIQDLIFSDNKRNFQNGYANPSVSKLKNAILYFVNRADGVFVTMMNKLLFYLDFLSYRERGVGFTGLSFQAIQHGPVPLRWDRVYSLIDDIIQIEVASPKGQAGNKIVSDIDYDKACFDEEEQELLDKVYETFKNDNSSSISKKSHNEDAWIKNIKNHSIIDYKYSFSLKAI